MTTLSHLQQDPPLHRTLSSDGDASGLEDGRLLELVFFQDKGPLMSLQLPHIHAKKSLQVDNKGALLHRHGGYILSQQVLESPLDDQ